MRIDNKNLLKALLCVRANNVFYYENLQNYLSFRPQDCFCKCLIECDTSRALIQTLRILKNPKAHAKSFRKSMIPHTILGNGSNTLVANFYDGYLVKLGKNFRYIKKLKSKNDRILLEVGAGTNLFTLNNFLKLKGIGGLEWSFGIPGSVGGATIMNAGAFGQEFGNFICRVKIIENGKFVWKSNIKFSYRNSSLKENKEIVVAVVLGLYKSSQIDILTKQQDFLSRRRTSQPYELNSAGSVFKRVVKNGEIIYPAKLIDNLGLKGATIRQAEISTKHAGFIVNRGNATGKDYLVLVELIENKVKKEYNLTLEREVEILK